MFFVEDEQWGRNVIECKKNEQDVIEIDDFDYSGLGKEVDDNHGQDETLKF